MNSTLKASTAWLHKGTDCFERDSYLGPIYIQRLRRRCDISPKSHLLQPAVAGESLCEPFGSDIADASLLLDVNGLLLKGFSKMWEKNCGCENKIIDNFFNILVINTIGAEGAWYPSNTRPERDVITIAVSIDTYRHHNYVLSFCKQHCKGYLATEGSLSRFQQLVAKQYLTLENRILVYRNATWCKYRSSAVNSNYRSSTVNSNYSSSTVNSNYRSSTVNSNSFVGKVSF